jgi:hypothetical protein
MDTRTDNRSHHEERAAKDHTVLLPSSRVPDRDDGRETTGEDVESNIIRGID